MIARLIAYRTPADALEPLRAEIAAQARASWPVQGTNRRVEFFFIKSSTDEALSLVIGEDRTVMPLINLQRPASEDPKEYDVHLLQVGAPTESGTVHTLFGRVVFCGPGAISDLSFNGDAVPGCRRPRWSGRAHSSSHGTLHRWSPSRSRPTARRSNIR
jgi:hypothetical protein